MPVNQPRHISPTPAAERQREYRRRRREGDRIAHTDVPADVVDGLIARGLVSEAEAADPRRLGDALADLADCFVRGTLTTGH